MVLVIYQSTTVYFFELFENKIFLATAMVQDSPLLCDQIKSLTSSINMLQRRLIKSEGRSMKTRVNNLPPIQKWVKIGQVTKLHGGRHVVQKWTLRRQFNRHAYSW